MGLKRRVFSKEFKEQVLAEVAAGKSMAQASREYRLHPNLIYRWRDRQEQYGSQAFGGSGNDPSAEAKIAALERKLGQLTMENDFLKKALARLEGHRRSGGDR